MKIEQQIKRLENLISRIDAGGYVSRPCLKKAIGEVGLQVLDSRWAEEKRTRGCKPNEIVEYSNRLRRGLQLHSIAKRASYDSNQYRTKVAWDKAAASLDSALEYLECAIASKPGLRLWIDRDPIDVDLCPEGVPRPIWSANACNKNSNPLRFSKREVTKTFLEKALTRLNSEIGNSEKIDVYFSLRSSRRTYVEADFAGFKF